MIVETDEGGWKSALFLSEMPIFFQPEYLNSIQAAFGIPLKYYLVQNDEITQAALAVFVKNGKIILPEHFTYTPLWLAEHLSERKKIALIKEVISHLKSIYSKIVFKLSPDIIDIRAFIWEGFEIENRYTYIKDGATAPHKSITRNLNLADLKNFACHATEASIISIKKNIEILESLNFSKMQIYQIKTFLNKLSQTGLLFAVTLYESENCIASNLVLLDKIEKKGYLLFASPVSRSKKFAHTFLYQETINWLLVNNYAELDFCGANFEGIANFKSFFNPKLKPYYIVRYSALRNKLRPLFKLLDRI